MPDGITISVQGTAALEEALKQLGSDAKKALRTGVRKGAVLIQKDAQSRIHSEHGDLAKSIRVGVRVKPADGAVIATIAATKKMRYIANFVEFGTKPHEIKAKNKKALKLRDGREVESVMHPGAKAKPFLRPAADTQFNAAVDAVRDETQAAVEKIKAKKSI